MSRSCKNPWHSIGPIVEPTSRRDFIKICTSLAVTLGLGPFAGCSKASPEEAEEWVERRLTDMRPCVLWLHLAECTGCTEAILRASDPSFSELIFDSLSLDYHEPLMALSGSAAASRLALMAAENSGEFFCVVEGAIPTAMGGNYGQIGGRTMLSIAEEICPQAKAILALGTCSAYGGIAAAAPNPTGAKGLSDALPDLKVPIVNIPGCPPNPINVLAVIVSYLLEGTLPELDDLGRPRFAYQKTVHQSCPFAMGSGAGKAPRFESTPAPLVGPSKVGVLGCQRSIGCKGTIAHNNCPSLKFNAGTSFPMQAGHPCIGCSEPEFWDRMTPFYQPI